MYTYCRHWLGATKEVSRGLTLDGISTPASPALVNLWAQQVEMSQALTSRAIDKAGSELHRAAMRVISGRLSATIERNADLMYQKR